MNVKWRDVPGYNGVYQASTDGQIRRVLKSGDTRLLVPYCHKARGGKRLVIKLMSPGGTRKETTMTRIMAETFLGPCPDGHVAYHINGMQNDNSIKNIAYISKTKLATRTGAASQRRPVVKIDASGEIVECYSSARAAGRANYVSYFAITARCNGKIKKPLALDGCDYRWDDLEEKKSLEREKRRSKNAGLI